MEIRRMVRSGGKQSMAEIVSIRVQVDEKEAWRAAAKDRGIAVPELIRDAVRRSIAA